MLDEAVQDEADIIDDDAALDDGEGIPDIPPPKVPVWNETPDEFEDEAGVAAPPITEARPEPAPVEPPAAPTPSTPMDALEAMLGDDDAPELVMDIAWDPETGWSGLPELTREPEPEAAAADATLVPSPEPAPDQDEDDEDSWDTLIASQAQAPQDPLAKAGVRPASRAAFETLLGRSGRMAAELPRPTRVRPVVHTVKPVRPWQAPSQHRTPYDDMIVEDEPSPTPAAQPAPSPRRARSSQEVHDLVAEVLNERSDPEPEAQPATRGNGVVELARYLRRQVSP